MKPVLVAIVIHIYSFKGFPIIHIFSSTFKYPLFVSKCFVSSIWWHINDKLAKVTFETFSRTKEFTRNPYRQVQCLGSFRGENKGLQYFLSALQPVRQIFDWRRMSCQVIEKREWFHVAHRYQNKSKSNKKIYCVFTANGNTISLRHPMKCLIIVVQGSQAKGG